MSVANMFRRRSHPDPIAQGSGVPPNAARLNLLAVAGVCDDVFDVCCNSAIHTSARRSLCRLCTMPVVTTQGPASCHSKSGYNR